jgi:carbohydrate diacid regulator
MAGSHVDGQFRRMAESVTEKVSELLRAPVFVMSDSGGTVATSGPDLPRVVAGQLSGEAIGAYLRVPFKVGDQAGEVVVGHSEEVEPVSARVAQALVEMIINEMAVIDRLPNQHEVKNKLIFDLLHGRIQDEEQILTQARYLGMDLTPPRAVVLIDASDYLFGPRTGSNGGQQSEASGLQAVRVQRQVQIIISSVVSFFHLSSETICAYIGEGTVAVLKATNTKNLTPWVSGDRATDETNSSWANLVALKRAANALLARLRNDTGASLSIAIGRYHPGLRGLAHSYRDARAALTLGRRIRGHNRVHCLDDMGVAGFVGISDDRTKHELAQYLLGPLDHEPELLHTLSMFFAANCSPSATASDLAIHRNTLSYRLDKIAALTGLDPRRFDDAVQIRLALLIRSLNAESSL